MLFTDYFDLKSHQYELDFVDIYLDSDLALFIDPYSISKYDILLYKEAHNSLCDYFEVLKRFIIQKDKRNALQVLSKLREPNEIHLGLSETSHGRGIGNIQSELLWKMFSESEALSKGYIDSLAKSELFIEGIGPDKISDITANIIRSQLILYTQKQCNNYGIEMRTVSSGPYWDQEAHEWVEEYVELPIYNKQRIILVPKRIARKSTSYDPDVFYHQYILDFLQAMYSAQESLGKALKVGKKIITKRELEIQNPYSKQLIYNFVKQHPNVLQHFEEDINRSVVKPERITFRIYKRQEQERFMEIPDYSNQLKNIVTGNDTAGQYHRIIFNILNYLFSSVLLNPEKEEKINEGRKRIDISYYNADMDMFFYKLREVHKIFCPYIFFECKNYSQNIENPEFDQIAGRLSRKQTMFGILVCRNISNWQKTNRTQQDFYFNDDKLILILSDKEIISLIEFRKRNEIDSINKLFETQVRNIVLKKDITDFIIANEDTEEE